MKRCPTCGELMSLVAVDRIAQPLDPDEALLGVATPHEVIQNTWACYTGWCPERRIVEQEDA